MNPLPVAAIAGNASSCSSLTLTASGGSTYVWSGGSNTSSASNTITASGTYTVSATNANGCVGTASQAITIYSLPTVSINSIGAVCASNGNVTLSGSPAGGTYSGNGVTGSSFNPASAGPGASTINYSYTDSHGCSASASTSVTVNANPTPQITSGVSSICSGTNAILQVASIYTSYIWNSNPVNHTNAISVYDSGNFVITVTNAAGCSGTAMQHIAVIPSPTAFISTSNGSSICSGKTDTLDAGHFDVYVWSNGSNNEYLYATTTGTYSVTITDVDGCTGVASKAITVNANPNPTITASGTTTFCTGGSVNLCSGQAYTNYNWGANGAGSCITVSNAGTYTLTVTNSNGCIGSATQSVTVNTKPTATVTASTNVTCTGSTNGTVTALASGGEYAIYLFMEYQPCQNYCCHYYACRRNLYPDRNSIYGMHWNSIKSNYYYCRCYPAHDCDQCKCYRKYQCR